MSDYKMPSEYEPAPSVTSGGTNPLDAVNAATIRQRIADLEQALAERDDALVVMTKRIDLLRESLAFRTSELKRVLAREHLVGDTLDEVCPGWDGEYEDAIRKLGKERDALSAALEKAWSYMRAASQEANGYVKAKLLSGLDNLLASNYGDILAARLASERKAGAVAALKQAAYKCAERRWEKDSDDEARTWTYGQGCFDCSALIDAIAAQIERGETTI